jgi:hypothetical protein
VRWQGLTTRTPHYYEYGGVVVRQPDGKFNASEPLGDYHADNMEIDEDPDGYDGGFDVVADYHTHPCISGYAPGVFSPNDLRSMRIAKHGGYILDECTGDVHYWKPGDPYDKPTDKLEALIGAHIATGKVVGHIPVDGKVITL